MALFYRSAITFLLTLCLAADPFTCYALAQQMRGDMGTRMGRQATTVRSCMAEEALSPSPLAARWGRALLNIRLSPRVQRLASVTLAAGGLGWIGYHSGIRAAAAVTILAIVFFWDFLGNKPPPARLSLQQIAEADRAAAQEMAKLRRVAGILAYAVVGALIACWVFSHSSFWDYRAGQIPKQVFGTITLFGLVIGAGVAMGLYRTISIFWSKEVSLRSPHLRHIETPLMTYYWMHISSSISLAGLLFFHADPPRAVSFLSAVLDPFLPSWTQDSAAALPALAHLAAVVEAAFAGAALALTLRYQRLYWKRLVAALVATPWREWRSLGVLLASILLAAQIPGVTDTAANYFYATLPLVLYLFLFVRMHRSMNSFTEAVPRAFFQGTHWWTQEPGEVASASGRSRQHLKELTNASLQKDLEGWSPLRENSPLSIMNLLSIGRSFLRTPLQIARFTSSSPSAAEKRFENHLLHFLLDVYFRKVKSYKESHIPIPLGYHLPTSMQEPESHNFYLFNTGSDKFPWWPFRLREWDKMHRAFLTAGVDIGQDVLRTNSSSGSPRSWIQRMVGSYAHNLVKRTGFSSFLWTRRWQRVDFGPGSVNIDTRQLKIFLKLNKKSLEFALTRSGYELLSSLIDSGIETGTKFDALFKNYQQNIMRWLFLPHGSQGFSFYGALSAAS